MSEYQYYEFITIDRPLTSEQMEELRLYSSRAHITPTRFTNHYHWGSFKGDSDQWMEDYFDAYVHVANWGSCVFSLRLPEHTFDRSVFDAYTTEETFFALPNQTTCILQWSLDESEDYSRFDIDDGTEWMVRLVPLREEILTGDMRSLYIGWLAGVSIGEVDADSVEPPPPPGLSRLTAAQYSLAEFLAVDQDLLTAAGFSDTTDSSANNISETEQQAWVESLPDTQKTALLQLLLKGNTQQAARELRRLFQNRNDNLSPPLKDTTSRRTVNDLLQLSLIAEAEREKQTAILLKEAEEKQQAERAQYLKVVASDFNKHWILAEQQIERGIASAYDDAKRRIIELSEAYALFASTTEFEQRLNELVARHKKRSAMMRRLKEASLCK